MQISQDIVDYLDMVDENYKQAKGSISRFDPEWGIWSREMNLEIREKLENANSPHPQPLLLKMVMLYWMKRSKLLELNYRGKMFGKVKKKRLLSEIKEIRDDILGNRTLPEGELSMFEFQQELLDGVVT